MDTAAFAARLPDCFPGARPVRRRPARPSLRQGGGDRRRDVDRAHADPAQPGRLPAAGGRELPGGRLLPGSVSWSAPRSGTRTALSPRSRTSVSSDSNRPRASDCCGPRCATGTSPTRSGCCAATRSGCCCGAAAGAGRRLLLRRRTLPPGPASRAGPGRAGARGRGTGGRRRRDLAAGRAVHRAVRGPAPGLPAAVRPAGRAARGSPLVQRRQGVRLAPPGRRAAGPAPTSPGAGWRTSTCTSRRWPRRGGCCPATRGCPPR